VNDDPKRLAEGGDLGASLLASARDDAPSGRARIRAAAALGLAAGAAVMTTSTVGAAGTAGAGASAGAGAGAVGAKAAAGGLWVKLVAAGVVASAVTGGAVVATRHNPTSSMPPAPVVTTQATSTATAAPTPKVTKAATPAPTAEDDSPTPAETVAPAPIVPPRPAHASTPTPSAESPLARELDALDRARSALNQGDPNAALVALDKYDRTFPKGSLRMSAQVLRAEALLARGDKAAAQTLAKQLLARDPAGPEAKRLRTIAGETGPR
jgi:hypothetical protein